MYTDLQSKGNGTEKVCSYYFEIKKTEEYRTNSQTRCNIKDLSGLRHLAQAGGPAQANIRRPGPETSAVLTLFFFIAVLILFLMGVNLISERKMYCSIILRFEGRVCLKKT